MAVNPIEDYVLIEYTSSFGHHTMTRPTRDWSGTPWATDGGTYTNWDNAARVAPNMIEGFIDLMLPLFKADTSFDSYTIYHVVTPGEPAIPVYAHNLTGKVGTSSDTSQSRSWERTYTFRTTGSFIAKICLLDTPCGGLVSRYNTLPALSPDLLLVAAFMDTNNAWSGRANERPVFFKTLTTQPNKALEEKYGVN